MVNQSAGKPSPTPSSIKSAPGTFTTWWTSPYTPQGLHLTCVGYLDRLSCPPVTGLCETYQAEISSRRVELQIPQFPTNCSLNSVRLKIMDQKKSSRVWSPPPLTSVTFGTFKIFKISYNTIPIFVWWLGALMIFLKVFPSSKILAVRFKAM